jgi:hypothetical protein
MQYHRLLLAGIWVWLVIAGWPNRAPAQAPSRLPAAETAPPQSGPVLAPQSVPVVSPTSEVDQLRQMGVVSDPSWWCWQVLPGGLMYRSYLAGTREPRMGSQLAYVSGHGWVWDATAGARVGLIRFGTPDDGWPEGWQLDLEGAAFPRLDLENERDLVSADFRVGAPITYRRGRWETKFGYYHLSSHLGDEYMIRHQESIATRDNYDRETLVAGVGFRPVPAIRLYTEAGYAFSRGGLTRPWEFQFGTEYSPIEPVGGHGAPFLALNGHLRQENDFGGNFVVQSGWQWRGRTGQLLRTGVQYFNGKSDQGQFINDFEQQIGMGLWYDF